MVKDVVVNLTATPAKGRTVTAIMYALAGAQSVAVTAHPGDSVDVTISAEGDTTLTFFAFTIVTTFLSGFAGAPRSGRSFACSIRSKRRC
jgi:hypothetical protein